LNHLTIKFSKMDLPPDYEDICPHGASMDNYDNENKKNHFAVAINYAIKLGAFYTYFRYGTGYLEVIFPMFMPELYLIYRAAVHT